MPLPNLVLTEREQAFYGPRLGDWVLLGLLIVILLGNGLYIWHQMDFSSHAGRVIFFGMLLASVLWGALVYMFKLSVCVRVGPHGMSVVRGPWRTELAWRDVSRLLERVQRLNGQRYRWLIVFARDGRRLQVREDMVSDYLRFKLTVNERYRLWSDHGGTWGTTGGGPYKAVEDVSSQVFWWAVLGGCLTLPGLYFAFLLPEIQTAGIALIAAGGLSAVMSIRDLLRRRTYTVDARALEVRRAGRTLRLAWRDVARVDRSRHPFGGLVRVGIGLGRVLLNLVARTDARVESFDWSPRVPEYLTLRGAGRLIRIRLHRLERPDEMLAWVEFYERVGRRLTQQEPRRGPTTTRRLAPALPAPVQPDLTSESGPVDPWGGERAGDPDAVSIVDDVSAESTTPHVATGAGAGPVSAEQTPAWLEDGPVGATDDDESEEEDTFSMPAARVETALEPSEAVHVSLPQNGGDALPVSESIQHAPVDPWAPMWQREATSIPMTPESQEPGDTSAGNDHEEGEDAFEWPDFAGQDDDLSDEEIESLADAVAPWRDTTWAPPPLPRFGPPSAGHDDSEADPSRRD
jgi:hypothetical protein